MNIGIFTDTYYPQINGVATSVRMLERQLTKMGHKVFIFTTTNPNALQPLPRVFRLPSMPVVFLKSHRLALLYPPKLLMKMKNINLDIIHTQTEFTLGLFGKVIADFYKIPHVHTYHTMYEDYVHYVAKGHLITPKMAQQFSRLFCNRAAVLISPGQKTKESLIDYGVVKPIKVIPTGIDFEPFSVGKYSKEEIEETKTQFGIKKDDKVIVSIGRIAKEKSIDIIINALPELILKMPDVKFVIVGDGPQREELEALAYSRGVSQNVIFAGAKPWDCIGKYYQIGDVFASASVTETQGLTYIEAMAAKTVVVAREDDCLKELIKHRETGFLFESASDCADALYEALSHKDLREQIAENAFQNIQHLSSRKFAENVLELYTQCTNGSESPRFEKVL